MPLNLRQSGINTLERLEGVRLWLAKSLDWPAGCTPRDVQLNRLWVGRHGKMSFELALDVVRDSTAESFLLQGRVGVPDKPVTPHVRPRLVGTHVLGVRTVSKSLGIEFGSPDRDKKLPAVRALVKRDPWTLGIRCESIPGGSGGASPQECVIARDCEASIRSYRLGKRCTLLFANSREPKRGVFIKVFRRPPKSATLDAGVQIAAALTRRTDGQVCTPSIIEHRANERLIVSSVIPPSARPARLSSEDVLKAAMTLAGLHGVPAHHLEQMHTARQELETATRWIPVVDRLAPECRRALQALTAALYSAEPTIHDSDLTVIHRDFHAGQLHLDDGVTWLTDFDTLALGHSEVDIATYVAHLLLAIARDDAGGFDEASLRAGRFISAYRDGRGTIDDERLRFYLPCAMARLGSMVLFRRGDPEFVMRFWRRGAAFALGDWTFASA